jgi:hypothetical protein
MKIKKYFKLYLVLTVLIARCLNLLFSLQKFLINNTLKDKKKRLMFLLKTLNYQTFNQYFNFIL